MATDLSNITVSGRIARDAVIKDVGSSSLCEFTLANSFMSGREEVTAWYRCKIWGKRGEGLQPHLVKGKTVIVGGPFSPREWETKEGEKRTSLDLDVQSFAFGGGGEGASQGGGSEEGGASGWE